MKLPAEKFSPFGKYPGSVTCVDDKGGKSAPFDFILLTIDASPSLFITADEGAGNTVKNWGVNQLEGQIMNGAGWMTGVNGSAITLSGQGPIIEFPYNSLFDFGTTPFTIAAWVLFNPSSTARAIFVHGDDNKGYKLYILPTGIIAFYTSDCYTFLNGGGIDINTWTHLAVTRNGNTFNLYENGSLKKSADCAKDLKTKTKLWLGCDGNGIGVKCVQPLNGSVDEVVILNRSLNNAEILAQCKLNDPTGTTCAGP